MTRRSVVVPLLALALTAGIVRAQQPSPAALLLEAADQKATIEGDLAGAIAQYEAIVARFATTDRAAAAQALLGLGDAYQKFGRLDEARLAYGRLVRDFPDERVAAEARTRLAALGEPASRRLWTGSGHAVSGDGRLISYVVDGVVFVHDVVTGADERLTEPADQLRAGHYAEVSAISRDGRQVAYSWSIGPRYQLRVVDRAAKPRQEPRVLIDDPEITFVYPLDWSPDGQTMVVQIGRTNRHAEIALVTARDRRIGVLKSIDWQGPISAAFSPDGRYVAYDVVVDEKTRQRDIFLLSTDATRESRAVDDPSNDVVAGWSPDGRFLLFVSSRSDTPAIWGQAITDGRAVGAPELLRSDLGTLAGVVGTTNTGALLFIRRTSSFRVHTATVDFGTGRIVTPGAPVLETYLRGQRNPAWARDGKHLAWSTPLAPGQPGVGAIVLSFETGQTTEVVGQLSTGVLRAWAPDGSLTYQGIDKGRSGIFRVDARDGHTTSLALSDSGFLAEPSWSEDGRFLVYRHQIPKNPGMVLRDMMSGTERHLLLSLIQI